MQPTEFNIILPTYIKTRGVIKWTIHKKSRKWLSYAAFSVVVLIATGMFLYSMSNATPKINIPARQMPSPNAYDYYVEAIKAIVRTMDIRNALYKIKLTRLLTRGKSCRIMPLLLRLSGKNSIMSICSPIIPCCSGNGCH